QQWAERLKTLASELPEQEVKYWNAESFTDVPAWPVDEPEGSNREQDAEQVTLSLSEEETQALLKEVPSVYRTQINEVLLAALAQATQAWTGSARLLVHMEGHGREEIGGGLDVTRTVGWFTSLYPVVVDISGTYSIGAVLKNVKEQLRNIPNKGIGYGIIKYGRDESFPYGPNAQVGFNYFGQTDSFLSKDTMLQTALESAGANVCSNERRLHFIDISGVISGGLLYITWTYSREMYKRATIESVAEDFMSRLRDIVALPDSETQMCYTLSDFPQARMSNKELDTLVGQHRNIETIYPLTPLQQGMLFHSLYEAQSGDYVSQLLLTIEGHFDPVALQKAWNYLIARHSLFRTTFAWEGLVSPHQIVYNQVTITIEQLDWRDRSPESTAAALKTYLQTDRETNFKLHESPLMRITLIRVDDVTYQMVWSHHHLLMDGWSLPIVVGELLALYRALKDKVEVVLEPALPFINYIEWIQRQDSKEAETYWRNELQGFRAPTSIPIGIGDGQGKDEQSFTLPDELTQSLTLFAKKNQMTLNTLVQGAWLLLLGYYSGERDVVSGTTVAGRPAHLPGVESMVGMFINTLPIRMVIDDTPVLAWIRKLQEKQMEISQYEHCSLVDIQGWSDVPRGSSLFETVYVFENYPIDVEGAEASTSECDGGEQDFRITGIQGIEQTNYPLSLQATPGDNLVLRMFYDRQTFKADEVERMLEYMVRLLREMTEKSMEPVETLRLMSTEEYDRVVVQWNATKAPYPDHACIHTLFEWQAKATPDAMAVVYGNRAWTYKQLNGKANALARQLKERGIGPEEVVAVLIERSPFMLVAQLAVLKAGGAFLPIDPEYPADRILFMLEDSKVKRLIANKQRLPLSEDNLSELEFINLVSQDNEVDETYDDLEENGSPTGLAYVIYTSGSTGRPKGVMVEHLGMANLYAFFRNEFGITPEDRIIQFASMSFDASIWETFMALFTGACLYLPTQEIIQDVAKCAEWMSRHRITVATLPPTYVAQIRPEDIPSLRILVTAGSAASSKTVRNWQSQVSYINAYGPTEATICTTFWKARSLEVKNVPIGEPIPNVEV
ncbi:condensation domain-containing protein, partial [Paenibacillus sp. JCM 10914]|uniref:condensation domain-containing protein n=1 Tax=Paenibacillus sp. JCM 10914 TaxID=1236974 RepID=UPI00056A2260